MRIPLRSICFRNRSVCSGKNACSNAACSLANSCAFSILIVACSKAMRDSFQILERETGIEPATNSLEGCDSTTELLPPLKPPSAIGRQPSTQTFALLRYISQKHDRNTRVNKPGQDKTKPRGQP